MAEGDEAEDKHFAPTQRRLQQAREEGQVPLSREVPVLAGLAVGVGVMMLAGDGLSRGLVLRLQTLIEAIGTWDADRQGSMSVIAAAGLAWLGMTAPVTLAVLVGCLASVVAQTGVLFRLEALQPDFSRVNPWSGLKRLLGLDHLIEALKSIVKIAVVAAAAWVVIARELSGLPSSTSWGVGLLLTRMFGDVAHLMLVMLAAQTVIAGFDVFWVRLRHSTRLRMTREDVRQETRETEGSPEVKQRLQRIRTARARRRMLDSVPKAAVVVTNPTHYAVALAYERGQTAAPVVVAKGVDSMAERIRELARQHDVPLVANAPLARALYTVEVGREIPTEHFQAVAGIIAYVWRMQARVAARRAAAVL
jgi:flagellar biosynthetic protein FlhB